MFNNSGAALRGALLRDDVRQKGVPFTERGDAVFIENHENYIIRHFISGSSRVEIEYPGPDASFGVRISDKPRTAQKLGQRPAGDASDQCYLLRTYGAISARL